MHTCVDDKYVFVITVFYEWYNLICHLRISVYLKISSHHGNFVELQ